MVGLVVIVAFCLYTAFAVFVAKRVGRLAKSRVGQNALIAAVLVVLLLAPIADGIYGYFVLQHLCATEAKTEVLKPIEIPPQLFNADGSPKFVNGKGNSVSWQLLRGLYEIKHSDTMNYRVRNLDRVVNTLKRVQVDEVLVRQTNFYYRGGWLQYNSEGIGNSVCIASPTFSEILEGAAPR